MIFLKLYYSIRETKNVKHKQVPVNDNRRICKYPWYPSILHTTRASLSFQLSSHTVPHPSPKFTSTLPFDGDDPPTRRMSTEKGFSL